MAFACKPSSYYSLNSSDGQNNLWQMQHALSAAGYCDEAIAGVCANCYAESGLNPWRWQGDTVNYGAGYGLFQFTPANGYIGPMSWVPGYAPNLSTSMISGGRSSDGDAQMTCLINDYLSKWVAYCWRDYWSATDYPYLWGCRTRVVRDYGNGSSLTQAQFKQVNDLELATFAFMACYEGQLVPSDFTARMENAANIYRILTGEDPTKRIPIWLLFKFRGRV